MNATSSANTTRPGPWSWLGIALLFAVTSSISLAAAAAGRLEFASPARAPERLADTGLYADFATRTIASDVLPFTPQYPLWTDGARKQRWIRLPRGAAIDATDPDAWRFPIGTKLWKEFAFERRVETRTMELGADGAWTYATYAWNDDESDAVLVPEGGRRAACTTSFGTRHDIPSLADCRACHTGTASEVLGFSALQLSSDRDPLALHAEEPARGSVDLVELLRRDLVRGLPKKLRETAPRIAAASPRERAALGYLHGNCGNCHNATGPLASLGLDLAYPLAHAEKRVAPAIRSTLGRPSRYQIWQDRIVPRIEGGAPELSTLAARMSSRSPVAAMPPLGTRAVDTDAVELVRAWIREDLAAGRDISEQIVESAAIRRARTHTRKNQESHR